MSIFLNERDILYVPTLEMIQRVMSENNKVTESAILPTGFGHADFYVNKVELYSRTSTQQLCATFTYDFRTRIYTIDDLSLAEKKQIQVPVNINEKLYESCLKDLKSRMSTLKPGSAAKTSYVGVAFGKVGGHPIVDLPMTEGICQLRPQLDKFDHQWWNQTVSEIWFVKDRQVWTVNVYKKLEAPDKHLINNLFTTLREGLEKQFNTKDTTPQILILFGYPYTANTTICISDKKVQTILDSLPPHLIHKWIDVPIRWEDK